MAKRGSVDRTKYDYILYRIFFFLFLFRYNRENEISSFEIGIRIVWTFASLKFRTLEKVRMFDGILGSSLSFTPGIRYSNRGFGMKFGIVLEDS